MGSVEICEFDRGRASLVFSDKVVNELIVPEYLSDDNDKDHFASNLDIRPSNLKLSKLGISQEDAKNEIIFEQFRLRHRVFNQKLNWKVQSFDGHEIDRFDMLNPWYVLFKGDDNRLLGSWRALPTTGANMLRNVFPQLARGEEIPCDENIWEISRFAVDLEERSRTAFSYQNSVSQTTFNLLQSFKEFGNAHGVNKLVGVTSVAAERTLRRLGLNVRRFGDGQAVKLGNVLATAIWIDLASDWKM